MSDGQHLLIPSEEYASLTSKVDKLKQEVDKLHEIIANKEKLNVHYRVEIECLKKALEEWEGY